MVPWGQIDQAKFSEWFRKGAKTSLLAHEFRTPARTVKSWLQREGLRRYTHFPDAELDAWVARARNEGHVRAGVSAIKGWIEGQINSRISAVPLRASVARVVPPELRRLQQLRELRAYQNRGPMAVVHSDGNHKVSSVCAPLERRWTLHISPP